MEKLNGKREIALRRQIVLKARLQLSCLFWPFSSFLFGFQTLVTFHFNFPFFFCFSEKYLLFFIMHWVQLIRMWNVKGKILYNIIFIFHILSGKLGKNLIRYKSTNLLGNSERLFWKFRGKFNVRKIFNF
jgi:hypothetical protein